MKSNLSFSYITLRVHRSWVVLRSINDWSRTATCHTRVYRVCSVHFFTKYQRHGGSQKCWWATNFFFTAALISVSVRNVRMQLCQASPTSPEWHVVQISSTLEGHLTCCIGQGWLPLVAFIDTSRTCFVSAFWTLVMYGSFRMEVSFLATYHPNFFKISWKPQLLITLKRSNKGE